MLGNCYFLASLAALAEYPDYIQRLFNTKTYNSQGIYSVLIKSLLSVIKNNKKIDKSVLIRCMERSYN
jgi:hypothetical protein